MRPPVAASGRQFHWTWRRSRRLTERGVDDRPYRSDSSQTRCQFIVVAALLPPSRHLPLAA
eukprot:3152298-Pyramimonas_sp.AAC.1